MTRKADRKGSQSVVGRASGEPEWSQVHDRRLTQGISINGEPAFIQAGDGLLSVLRVQCTCGQPVGMVWQCDPSGRGRSPFTYLEAQIIADPDARPITTHMALRFIGENQYPTDCTQDGRIEIDGNALLKSVRKGEAKVKAGADKMPKFVVTPLRVANK